MADELYFGDKSQLAIVLLMREQLNAIREQTGLTLITEQQIKTAFKNKLIELGHVCETVDPL